MDKTRRPYYPTKAAWARAQADAIAQRILAMPTATEWRESQRKARAIAAMRAEEARFRRIAERFSDAA